MKSVLGLDATNHRGGFFAVVLFLDFFPGSAKRSRLRGSEVHDLCPNRELDVLIPDCMQAEDSGNSTCEGLVGNDAALSLMGSPVSASVVTVSCAMLLKSSMFPSREGLRRKTLEPIDDPPSTEARK